MPLEAPRLDDRTYDDLRKEAIALIPTYCPEWTDFNASDPGITLIELFAYMTDIALYRMNRVPEKHYIKFLELIGMRLREPESAKVPVTFWLTTPQQEGAQQPRMVIDALTEVATTRTESSPAIVFRTDQAFEIRPPKLRYVLTSRGNERIGRSFRTHDSKKNVSGYEGFLAFAGSDADSDIPQEGDAYYLGFEEDLSYHILGIEMEVVRAKGEGVKPNMPPYKWQAIGLNPDAPETQEGPWATCERDGKDTTQGLNESGLIRIHLPQMQLDKRDGKTAYWVRCVLDEMPPDNRYRESPKIRRLAVGGWGATIPTTNVADAFDEVLGRSDGTPGQRFFLRNTPVVARRGREKQAEEYIIIRPEGKDEEIWEEVEDFSHSGEYDPHYTIDSSSGEVRFGPALPQRDGTIRCYGAIPEKKALITMRAYRYGGGQIGNVASNTLNVNKSGLPYIEKVRNRKPAAGGKDLENLEDCKVRAPGHLRAMHRAVTAADFEYLAMEAAPNHVARTFCLQSPAYAGLIQVLVIPKVAKLDGAARGRDYSLAPENLKLSTEVQTQIKEHLNERRLLCTRIEIIEPDYVWVKTIIRLRPSPLVRKERVLRDVETRLLQFLHPLSGGLDGMGWPFGRKVTKSEILLALQIVPGIDFIRDIQLYRVKRDASDGSWDAGEEQEEITLTPGQVIASRDHVVISD